MKKELQEWLQSLTVKLLVAVLSFVGALSFFAWVIHEAFMEREDLFDQKAFAFFDANIPQSFLGVVRFFTFLGKPEFLIPVFVLLLGYFIISKQKNLAISFAVLGLTSTGMLFTAKALFKRHRPELPVFRHLSGYSFPSGHALLSFALCSFLIYWLWESNAVNAYKWIFSTLLVVISLCVGISRIVLRVHYATDVIAGFCLGYVWVFILFGWQHFKKRVHISVKNDDS